MFFFIVLAPGLPGRAKSVKRFERSNGLDTALYKNYFFTTRVIRLLKLLKDAGTGATLCIISCVLLLLIE